MIEKQNSPGETALFVAVLDLATEQGCAAGCLPIPDTEPPRFVAFGESAQLLDLVHRISAPVVGVALGPHYDKCPQCEGPHTLDNCPRWRFIEPTDAEVDDLRTAYACNPTKENRMAIAAAYRRPVASSSAAPSGIDTPHFRALLEELESWNYDGSAVGDAYKEKVSAFICFIDDWGRQNAPAPTVAAPSDEPMRQNMELVIARLTDIVDAAEAADCDLMESSAKDALPCARAVLLALVAPTGASQSAGASIGDASVVAEGWKLVPIKPDRNMLNELTNGDAQKFAVMKLRYSAMLAVATAASIAEVTAVPVRVALVEQCPVEQCPCTPSHRVQCVYCADHGKWSISTAEQAKPIAPTALMYTVGPTRCNCHSETCCCEDWAVYEPGGEKDSTYSTELAAQIVADSINGARAEHAKLDAGSDKGSEP